MVPGIKRPAYLVSQARWQIHEGLASTVGTLNGDGLPTVAFKCKATLSTATGHADVAGSVTIDGETISFNSATTKTFTKALSALPTISVTGLDCNVLVEAVTLGGAPIYKETLTAIKLSYGMTERLAEDSMGKRTIREFEVLTSASGIQAGDIIRVDSVDYTVDKVDPKYKPSGRLLITRLVLRQ